MEYVEILPMFLKAFTVGGGIRAVAQPIIHFTDLAAGKMPVMFMLAGIVLTALGLYRSS